MVDQAQGQSRPRFDRFATESSCLRHTGDVAPVGEGISALRIHFGPGYRVYFRKQGKTVIILLCGGDKSSQAKDIKKAKKLAEEGGD